MKNFYLIATLYCFISARAQQQNNSFTLQQAVEYALKNSAGYLNAELDQKSAEYKRNEVAGMGLPQVSGSIDIKDFISLPTSLLPGEFFGAPPGTFLPVKFGTKYNSTAGFSASQLIFSSDYIIGLKAAKEYINLSRVNLSRSKADLVSQVSKAYFNAIINKERIKLLDANILRLKKILNDTKALNVQGFAELIDVERLEVQLNNLNTEKDKIVRLISLSENILKFQMGYKISETIILPDSISLQGNEENIISAGKTDVSKRPEYQLIQSQQRLYDMDLKRLKWGYLPTLAAYGSYQFNAQRQKFDFFDASKQWFKIALIGATFNVNIFDGFQRHNKIQQAKIVSNKNLNTLKIVESSAELEASVAGILYSNAYLSMLTQKKNMELATHVYEVAQKKFEGGIGNNLEIVMAQTSLKEAQTNYFNAVYDILVAKIDYQKATGTLIK